ncbi:MAG: tetraacyldisaccharide 4'-kinase [Pseudomonadota bacterium]
MPVNVDRWANRVWYGDDPAKLSELLLRPLEWLYRAVIRIRTHAYQFGILKTHRLDVPVLVVGNLAVGGTGKTPLVIWMAQCLLGAGFRPGIICRGYRGRATDWPRAVSPSDDPVVVGDESVLLAKRAQVPVVAGPNRVAAARALIATGRCDVVVSDDGLQHRRLNRDLEIVVVDAVRRYGNERCLPAGPLREPMTRLRSVDAIVMNGESRDGGDAFAMTLVPGAPRRVLDDQPASDLERFLDAPIHAVAGIGRPKRFFDALRATGMDVIEHAFPDHHDFVAGDLAFDDDALVMMTEKDAVKCRAFADRRHWFLPVDAEPSPGFADWLAKRMAESPR